MLCCSRFFARLSKSYYERSAFTQENNVLTFTGTTLYEMQLACNAVVDPQRNITSFIIVIPANAGHDGHLSRAEGLLEPFYDLHNLLGSPSCPLTKLEIRDGCLGLIELNDIINVLPKNSKLNEFQVQGLALNNKAEKSAFTKLKAKLKKQGLELTEKSFEEPSLRSSYR